jgi:hypothetical protein
MRNFIMMGGFVMSRVICELLATLNPATAVTELTVQGEEVNVRTFASFDQTTEVATFIKRGGNLYVVDCNSIDGMEFKV